MAKSGMAIWPQAADVELTVGRFCFFANYEVVILVSALDAVFLRATIVVIKYINR